MKILKKILCLLLVIAMLGGFAAAGYWYTKLPKPQSMTISLLYKGASDGRYPDGTRLDPYEVLSDEILESAGWRLGMMPEYLKTILTITYLGAKDQTTTDILVECDAKNDDASRMVLTVIGEEYEKYMKERFRVNRDIIHETVDVTDMDYLEAADTMELDANRLNGYISERLKTEEDETKKLKYSVLSDEVKNIVGIRIKGMREIASKEGISSKPAMLVAIMTYRQNALQRHLVKSTRQKESRQKGIELYDATLFPTTSVPSIKGGEYYISTTRTGLDDIFADTKFFIDEELAYEKELSEVNYILANQPENMRSKELEPEKVAIAQAIENIKKSCAELEAEEVLLTWSLSEKSKLF